MKYVQNKDIVARTVAGENLLVPVNQCTKKVFTLSRVGLYLWNLIEKPCLQDELADALVGKYQIERDRAMGDVQAFLTELVRLELALQEN